MTIEVRRACLEKTEDVQVVQHLIHEYARHPMGQSGDLPPDVRARMMKGLAEHPTTLIFLAEECDDSPPTPCGVAVCFRGYSTFKAAPLINIHDLFVAEHARGKGIGGRLLDAVADYGRQTDCCAVTLEVRSDNPARKLYEKKEFAGIAAAQDELGAFQMLFGKLELTSD